MCTLSCKSTRSSNGITINELNLCRSRSPVIGSRASVVNAGLFDINSLVVDHFHRNQQLMTLNGTKSGKR